MGSAWDWNEDDLRYLVTDEYWTAKQVAEYFEIPYVTVNRKLRAMGINHGRGVYERAPHEDDPVLVSNVAQRYVEAGMTVAEIAADLGLGRKKVANILARACVPRRPAAHLGGARDQSGSHNNNWRGGPGVRPCDRRSDGQRPAQRGGPGDDAQDL